MIPLGSRFVENKLFFLTFMIVLVKLVVNERNIISGIYTVQ